MSRLAHLFLALCLVALTAQPVFAVKPDEVLANPALEARARSLSEHLRCMVCQNQSIDESDAELARDLRVLVRERLVAGDTDDQVTDYIVSRYGEFVLLKPRFNLRNGLLWAAPVIFLLGGGFFMLTSLRRRKAGSQPEALTDEEQAALNKIVARDD